MLFTQLERDDSCLAPAWPMATRLGLSARGRDRPARATGLQMRALCVPLWERPSESAVTGPPFGGVFDRVLRIYTQPSQIFCHPSCHSALVQRA
jgi:hypothetical protein